MNLRHLRQRTNRTWTVVSMNGATSFWANQTTVHTDHANLTYYRKPQKLTPRAKRAVAHTLCSMISLSSINRASSTKADALSRRPDYPHKPEEPEETAFPEHMFINAASVDLTLPSLMTAQHDHRDYLQTLATTHPLSYNGHCWYHNLTQLVVPEDNELRRGVISLFRRFHDCKWTPRNPSYETSKNHCKKISGGQHTKDRRDRITSQGMYNLPKH